jgi:pilus assembly protein Flp/PilA
MAERTLCQHADSEIDTPTEVLRWFARSTGTYRLRGWTTVNKGEVLVKNLVSKLRIRRVRRDDGASAVEYGLLVALIAVVIAGTVFILGQALNNRFNHACDSVSGQSQGAPCAAPSP